MDITHDVRGAHAHPDRPDDAGPAGGGAAPPRYPHPESAPIVTAWQPLPAPYKGEKRGAK